VLATTFKVRRLDVRTRRAPMDLYTHHIDPFRLDAHSEAGNLSALFMLLKASRCACHSSGKGFRNRWSCHSGGWRPSRMISTTSGASKVSRSTSAIYEASFRSLAAPDLKAMWRRLFETEPPPYNRRFLESLLADQILGTRRIGSRPSCAVYVMS
jgi:hypothetical protein